MRAAMRVVHPDRGNGGTASDVAEVQTAKAVLRRHHGEGRAAT